MLQMLRAQVIEQHSRMNQLQNDLHAALKNQHLSGSGDASQHLCSTSGTRGYQIPATLQAHVNDFSTPPSQSSTGHDSSKLNWSRH